MKKSFLTFLLVALLAPLCLTSCSEDDNEVEEFPNWRQTNEEQLAALYERAQGVTDGSWKVIKNYTLEDAVPGSAANSIVVEVLQAGTGSGSPMFSDSVKINYRGRLLPSTSYPDGYVFDESYTGDYNPATANPVTMYVGELVDGFATALQNMRIGDHWRVYMPYQLGYGVNGTSSGIPGYSTLVFDIALVAYYRAGTSTRSLLAEPGEWVTE